MILQAPGDGGLFLTCAAGDGSARSIGLAARHPQHANAYRNGSKGEYYFKFLIYHAHLSSR
ncbi:hypothetical protein CHN51_10410 [Sphingorhabdus sp. YGSMI21]|nr:hypothetical protein CHN51_10410 [Sphingorhabdus sp. YGSMI21]